MYIDISTPLDIVFIVEIITTPELLHTHANSIITAPRIVKPSTVSPSIANVKVKET